MLEWMLAGGAVAYYGLFVTPTKWLKVERVRLPLGLNKKLVQISDLHVERLRIPVKQLASVLEAEQPDYIMLTGDFTRRPTCLVLVESYLRMAASFGVPVYAVLGNHDYRLKGHLNRLIDLMERTGVRLLRNESVQTPEFRLIGLDNFGTGHSRIRQAFAGSNPDETIIVITHDPNVVPYIPYRYDYLLSGHLHGKQFNIPFFFKISPKGNLPAQGIYKGLHYTEQGTYYISKGIGQTAVNARFLVRSEITVHEV